MKGNIIFVFSLAALLPLSGCLGGDLAPVNEDGGLVLWEFDAREPICIDTPAYCGDGVDDGEIILNMVNGEDISYSVVRIYVSDVELSMCGQGEEANCWDKSDSYDDIWSVDQNVRLYTDNEGTYSVSIKVMEYGEEPYGNTYLDEVTYYHEVAE
tara:strand:- start:6455 stop:6919 length:465 start_codon:yes stop_codon:yes gene_type:complete